MRPTQSQPQHIYGHALGYGAPWASSANLSNPVHPSDTQVQKSKFKSSFHLPSAVTGQLHAASASVSNLNDTWNQMSAQYLNQGAALCDRLSSKLDTVITCMDEERFSGDEKDLSESPIKTSISSISVYMHQLPFHSHMDFFKYI